LLVSSGDLEITVQIGVGVEVSIDELGITPHAFALHQNYPNPFNPETTIQIDLAKKSDVSVSIYNLMGHRVATLLKGTLDQGIYNIKWNGLSDNGISLPSGMYFYEMKSPEYHSVKKLVLVK
jgi:flagellar hook assembly protein FlgD